RESSRRRSRGSPAPLTGSPLQWNGQGLSHRRSPVPKNVQELSRHKDSSVGAPTFSGTHDRGPGTVPAGRPTRGNGPITGLGDLNFRTKIAELYADLGKESAASSVELMATS